MKFSKHIIKKKSLEAKPELKTVDSRESISETFKNRYVVVTSTRYNLLKITEPLSKPLWIFHHRRNLKDPLSKKLRVECLV